MIVYSAQQVTQTRICAAERCPRDAEPHSRLCAKCAQSDSVVMHINPPIVHTLPCASCKRELPDEAYSRKADAHTRRHRHHECKACTNERRQGSNRVLTPEQRARATQRNSERRKRQRAELRAIREAQRDKP